MVDTDRFTQLLQQLFAAVQRRDPSAREKILTLLKKTPEEPNLLHLAGLACMEYGDYQPAISYFNQSLKKYPIQPEVNNNLARAYSALGLANDAERHYRKALSLQPLFTEAWKNLGLLLTSQQRYRDAETALKRALEQSVSDVGTLTAVGNLHKEQEHFEPAISYYQQALAIDPDYVNALHNLGLCYKLTENLNQAIACFQRAQALAPRHAEIDLNYANALYELGRHEEAEGLYVSAIEKNPQFLLAHETLSELYWQSGQLDKIENSYQQAIRAAPKNAELRLSFANMLIATGRSETARTVVEEALKIKVTNGLLQAQGKLHANDLDYDSAQASFEAALNKAFTLDIAQDLTRLHIIRENYPQALALVNQTQEVVPDDQLSWALKGLCWRLMDDPQYHWLIDYEAYIKGYQLPVPVGYASLADFLEELEVVLLNMHKARVEPSRQTLKHGTQTPGRLLHKPHPVIQSYKASLTEAVQVYISSLPDDDSSHHPLLGRKTGIEPDDFAFSGSWSVKLQSSGFHINHVHPEGWISSACYISLPRQMVSGNTNVGAIKFGESALGLGQREVIERVIHPQAGQLVLFPSYVWHGTFDFEADPDDYRLTAPVDVIPMVRNG